MGGFELLDNNAIYPSVTNENKSVYKFYAKDDIIIPSLIRHILIDFEESGLFCLDARAYTKDDIEDADSTWSLHKPTIVSTGVKVNLEQTELLSLFVDSDVTNNYIILFNSETKLYKDDEVKFAFYNMQPFNIKINKGDLIGYGAFERILLPNEIVSVVTKSQKG